MLEAKAIWEHTCIAGGLLVFFVPFFGSTKNYTSKTGPCPNNKKKSDFSLFFCFPTFFELLQFFQTKVTASQKGQRLFRNTLFNLQQQKHQTDSQKYMTNACNS